MTPSATSPTASAAPNVTSHLLSELPLNSDTLMFGLNYKHTLVDKKGIINRMKGNKQAMDIDISCALFDETLTVVDMVWFKQLRDASEAIRHYGDSLDGNDRSDAAQIDRNVDVETIELRLSKLPLKVTHLTLFVSSYYDYALRAVERGNLSIGDDEGNEIFTLDLTHLDEETTALCVASLSRELAGWRLTLNNVVLDDSKMQNMVVQIQKELLRLPV